ncbi:MAG: pyridoxal phosphate-dependent aminotransferase [Bacteroidales bacterium]|nr:pyridoxal phosphate-dependent aminotransferase [Bacteroidales bacterium]
MKASFDFETPVNRRDSGSYKWDADLPEGVILTPAQRDRVIPLWVADMDFQAAPCIRDALRRRVEHGVFGYTRVPDSYYESVIRWFGQRHGLTLQRDWIQYTTGVVPALSAVIKALAAPGEGVIVQTPVYNCFFSSIRNNGCRIVSAPLSRRDLPDGSFTYAMDFDVLEAACADPANRILLLCNPHNPAGRRWNAEELRRAGDIARRHGVIVVSDEIHCEIVAPGTAYTPYASLGGDYCRDSVTLGSPSKSFNTAGLQIANIICERPEWREKIDKAININEICDVNPFGPVALEAAYSEEGARWLAALNEVIWKNYEMLRAWFRSALPEFPVAELEATYLAWIDTSVLPISSEAIEAELLRGEQVWINAGSMYGADGFIRINLACPSARLQEGLDRIVTGLRRLLADLPRIA